MPTSPFHHSSFRIQNSRTRAFTLIEILVTVGIIAALAAILLPTLAKVRRSAARSRFASDLQAIVAGLEEYKHDFGDYPRVEYTTGITGTATRPEPPTGAQVLCWALLGPAPIYETPQPAAGQHAIQDGADGPGFRTRITKDSSGNPVGSGKVFGPYLTVGKFHVGDPTNPTATGPNLANTNSLLWTLLDTNNKPILYAPASPKNLNPRDLGLNPLYISSTTAAAPSQTFVWDLTDLLGDSTTLPGFAADTNGNLFTRLTDSNPTVAAKYRLSGMLGDRSNQGGSGGPDGRITDNETPASTGPYLLWMAGYDEKFGPDAEPTATTPNSTKDLANCDDVTNFNIQ